jgi:hypothetical protein
MAQRRRNAALIFTMPFNRANNEFLLKTIQNAFNIIWKFRNWGVSHVLQNRKKKQKLRT